MAITGDVYYYWVSGDRTSSSTTTDTAWSNWCADDPGTWSGTTDTTWSNWCSGSTGTAISYDGAWTLWASEPVNRRSAKVVPYKPRVIIPERTVEEKRAKEAQIAINKIWRDLKIQEARERRRVAELTAQELLMDLIGEDQLIQYRESKSLVVKGRKHDYVLDKTGGVYKVEKSKVVNLCIHLRNRTKFPETDNIIGLKLMIEANEKEFLKTANNHGEVYDGDKKDRIIKLVNRAA